MNYCREKKIFFVFNEPKLRKYIMIKAYDTGHREMPLYRALNLLSLEHIWPTQAF